ncbi:MULTISPECIES: hypothetical protein [unclassified Commensalibacter]|uniref:hypothetical protein n=1 Tax=unclassified Commensalibacter TaxID=2630218 RepID=UPI0018DD4BF9|nr:MULTISPECIES: hypothetical protein [unclassified Commensalibacter]MBH9970488.1 hypothetical protein [Commensalibacter sp. M0265]MBH9977817.1 hypothetical protein [Commensalibacter sp. M0266]MBH9993523.1 hypothetical protein [Commensalibacter sp. M0270]MBI0047019.1 hypothetical protein [Commensalibacter sp. M0267]MBI0056688.1 hypothetical protein [Commensalibacter sp. M0268]
MITAHGKDSAIQQISGNNRLPVHIEASDCVVHSFINNSDKEYYHRGYVNEEA